jgi:hypothetical protein
MHVKRLQAMLTQQPWWIRSTIMKTETGVTSLATDRVLTRTWPVASLLRRSVANDVGGTTATCVTSSTAEMHTAGSKTGVESESAWNRISMMRGTMIDMVPTTTNLTDNAPLKEGII